MEITPTRDEAQTALKALEKTIKAAGADKLSKISEYCAAVVLLKDSDRNAFNDSYVIAATYMAQNPKEYLSIQIAQRLGSATYLAEIAKCPTDCWEKVPKSTTLKAWTKSWVGRGEPLIDLNLSADIFDRAVRKLAKNFKDAMTKAPEETLQSVRALVAQLASEGSADGVQLHSMLQTYHNQNIMVDFARLLVFYQSFQRHLQEAYPNLENRPQGFEEMNRKGAALVGACANLITLSSVLGTSTAVEEYKTKSEEVNKAIDKWAQKTNFSVFELPTVWSMTSYDIILAERSVDNCIREWRDAAKNDVEKAESALGDAVQKLRAYRGSWVKIDNIYQTNVYMSKEETVLDAKKRAQDVLALDLTEFLRAELELANWFSGKVGSDAKDQCVKQTLVVQYNMAVLARNTKDQTEIGKFLVPYGINVNANQFITANKKDVGPLIQLFIKGVYAELEKAKGQEL